MAMNKQRRTANLNNIVTYDTLKNVTLLADLTVEGLTGAGFVKADANGLLSVDTGAYLPMPSQTGNGGKYLTTDGVNLSWGTVSTANIYNSNGTLTANRTISAGGFTLTINPLTTFSGAATAASSEAIAHKFTPTLTAIANSDRLIGLDILPTFVPGAFTGVGRWGTRTRSLWINHDTWNSLSVTPALSIGDKDATAFYIHPGIGTTDTTELFMRGNNPAFGAWYFTIKANYNVTISAGPYVENMYFNMGGTNAMTIKGTSNVIVGGSTDGGFKFDVQGTARVSGLTTLSSGDFLQTASSSAIWFSDGNNPLRIVRTYALLNLDNSGTLTLASNLNVQKIFSTLNQDSGGTGIYTASITATVSGVNRNMNNLNRQVLQLTSTGGGSVVNGPKLSFLDISRGDATGFSSYVGIDVKDLDSYFGSTSGSVAIGSSATPAYRLDVTGTGRFTGALYSNTCIYATGNQSDGALNVSNPNTSGFSTVIINRADVTNCFGNIAFVDRKTGALGRGFSIGIGISGDPTWADGDFIIGNYTGTGGWTQSARIFNATGNWKIGSNTTDAGYKLDIVGTSRVQLPAVGTSSYFVLSSASATAFNSYFGVTGSDFAFSKGEYSWGTNLKFNGTTFVRDNTGVGSWMISQSCGNDVANHFFRIRNVNPNVGTVNSSAFVIGGSGIVGINREPVSGVGLSVSGTIGGDGLIIDQSVSRYVLGLSSASLRLTLNDAALPVFQIANSSSTAIVFNSTSSYASAQLAIDSTTRGFLPPRMNTTQKTSITSPAAGLIVYDTSTNVLNYYDGVTWVGAVAGTSTNIYTSDGTLSGNRYINGNSKNLWINDINTLRVSVGVVATNEVALFEGVEPNIAIKATGATNSASLFLHPSAGYNGAIHNRTGGGIDFYVGATPSIATTIKSTGAVVVNSTLGLNGVEDSVKSGTYTPTVTVVSGGATSVTTNVARYTRVGNVVTVYGVFFYQPSGSGAVETNNQFRITLPITRTVTTNFASGTVSFTTVSGVGNQAQGYLFSMATTTIDLYAQNWWSGSGANAYYVFSYEVN